ncbi:MAG: PEGA domain-containing protein [Candidatus Thermoplasmatota archaeon]|jgi:type II secretory pathway pseudopilin PulG|nr:PEGA domain-containing protein [Candidatus Thermoplasmatota archaeon]MCL6002907.1 PEGA domain-containing protein [Candidatus Thermoplasmatota archaeon]
MIYKRVFSVLIIGILLFSAATSFFSATDSSTQHHALKQNLLGVQQLTSESMANSQSTVQSVSLVKDSSYLKTVPNLAGNQVADSKIGYRLESSFSNLTPIFQKDSVSSSPEFFMTGLSNTMASNGSSVIFSAEIATNYTTVLIQYTLSNNNYHIIQYFPTYYVNGAPSTEQITGVTWVNDGYLISVGNSTSDSSYLELYNGISFREVLSPSGEEQLWTTIGQTSLTLILEGYSFTTSAATSLYELSLPSLDVVANLTNVIPANSYYSSAAVEGNDIFLAGENFGTSSSIYALINEKARTYSVLNSPSPLSPNQFTVGSTAVFLDGRFYAGGYKGYYNYSINSSGQETFFSSYSIAGEFVSYNPTSQVFTNLSSLIPDKYSVDCLVNLQGNPALVLDKYNGTLNLTTSKWLNYTSDYLFYSFNPQKNITANETSLTSTEFEPFYALNSSKLVILGGYNATTNEYEIETINQSTLKTFEEQFVGTPASIGNDYPQAWISSITYANGGYLTVGGDGLIFFNGSFESPQINQKIGYLLGAAWDGSGFLVVGSKFGPRNGALMYLYYPQNNTLVNESSLFQASLQTQGQLLAVAWYDNQFYIFGDVNGSVYSTTNIFYSFNPYTNALTNLTTELPTPMLSTPNSREIGNPIDLVTTPFGLFILCPSSSSYGSQLWSFHNSSFFNLTSVIPSNTDNNPYSYSSVSAISYGVFCSRSLMAWNGTALELTGTYRDSQNSGIPDVYLVSYYPETGSYTYLYQPFTGANPMPISLSWSGEFFELSGFTGNGIQYSPVLWLFSTSGGNFSAYDLGGDIPSSWIEVDSSSNDSNIFLVNSDFGDVSYGLEEIQFVPVTYSIVFNENGLPYATDWSISLNGTTKSSSTDQITFTVPNGTYYYLVSTISGYSSSNSGNVTVDGANISETVSFTRVEYVITFIETGIPVGATWTLTLNGTEQSSSTDQMSFQEPNGSYQYYVGQISGYGATPSSSIINVNGAGFTESILFSLVPQVGYFTGTIAPSNSSLIINGASYSITGGVFNISLDAGTYTVTFSAPGYSSYSTNITISPSKVTALQQTLNKKTTNSFLLYEVVIILVIVVVVGVSLMIVSRRGRATKKEISPKKTNPPKETINPDVEKKTSELKRLLESGYITKEDYEEQVNKILNKKK